MKLYIAFSIHGSNTFITANREVPHNDLSKIGGEFTVIPSRRAGANVETDGVKLGWSRLNTKDGKPLRSPALILRAFNELAEQGWTVDKQKFIDRHYKKDRK
jgi:hypothetical protein